MLYKRHKTYAATEKRTNQQVLQVQKTQNTTRTPKSGTLSERGRKQSENSRNYGKFLKTKPT